MHSMYFQTLEDACQAVGVDPASIGPSGRADVIGDAHGQDDGSVYFFPDGQGGCVTNWKDGEARAYWFVNQRRYMTTEEKKACAEELAKRRVEVARLECSRIEHAKRLCDKLLRHGVPITNAQCFHPYMNTKHVKPIEGGRPLFQIDRQIVSVMLGYVPSSLTGDAFVVVPLSEDGRNYQSLQFIDAQGNKAFLSKAPLKASFWSTRQAPPRNYTGAIGVAEGVATALSIDLVHNIPTVVALSCGRLPVVTKRIRQLCPLAKLIYFADHDPNKAGVKKAQEASAQYGGVVLSPADYIKETTVKAFREKTNKPEGRISDFNDLFIATGVL